MAVLQQGKFVIYSYSKLFITLNRTFCIGDKPKIVLGSIIKDANKENKALFGKLLETRKERRKNINNSSKNNGVPVNQEVTQKTAKKVRRRPKSDSQLLPRSEVRLIKASNSDSKESIPQDNELDTNVIGDTKVLGHYDGFTLDICEPKNENIDIKADSRTSTVLPSIILKNIYNFPMINCHKNVETLYSLKTFDSSCLTNKQMSRLYPSVGKILNSTMSEHSKMLLKKWREKMVSELGQEGFMKFYKAQLNSGIQFHMAVQSFLRGTPADDLVLDAQGVDGCWKSLASVISNVDDVQVLEGPVRHSDLLYHGVMDCVAAYQGEAVVIEWKKSDKPKPTIERTFDAPIQLSAYIGAMNYDHNYPIQIKGGLVVVAYSDGSPANAFHLALPECHAYWKLWLQRLQSFWQQQNQGQSASNNPQLSS